MSPPDPKDPRRSGCPIDFSLGIFGDRWTLLILRDLLLLGRRHFKEFLDAGEGISTNILSERLRRLEARGVIESAPDPTDGRRVIYRPTKQGMGLLPVLLELAAWGARNDPHTAAPPDFADRFEADRDKVLAEYRVVLDGE